MSTVSSIFHNSNETRYNTVIECVYEKFLAPYCCQFHSIPQASGFEGIIQPLPGISIYCSILLYRVQTIAKRRNGESCKPRLLTVELLTLSCLYILEKFICFKSKHDHTRDDNELMAVKHKTVV
ncbi:hypothetical protein J6590_057282 [Homalodisca vitripennis]|nr:hypothetical protein J6590_057282 [Homalodisca vitripennis]